MENSLLVVLNILLVIIAMARIARTYNVWVIVINTATSASEICEMLNSNVNHVSKQRNSI